MKKLSAKEISPNTWHYEELGLRISAAAKEDADRQALKISSRPDRRDYKTVLKEEREAQAEALQASIEAAEAEHQERMKQEKAKLEALQ